MKNKKEKKDESLFCVMTKIVVGITALGGLLILKEIIDTYTINGESVARICKMSKESISDRIKLAVKEERYSDAAELKGILDGKK